MTEPERPGGVQPPMRRLNPTVIALLVGVVLLLLLIAYFATGRNPDQDKLNDSQVSTTQAANPEKICASQSTYDLIKRDLFRRAAQLRGSDQAAYDKLVAYAVVRMEDPVLEGEDKDTHAVHCSGSLSLDLPPGVAVVGGRRTLMSDIDYTVQRAADGSGMVVLLRNADSIITPLATLSRPAQPAQEPAQIPDENSTVSEQQTVAPPVAPEPPSAPAAPRPTAARPSFDCASARTRGEIAVCSDSGLATLDRNMAAEYGRAVAEASPDERELLRDTARRFYAYRDHCPDNRCVAGAYAGRMREIRDIMEGRWQPPR